MSANSTKIPGGRQPCAAGDAGVALPGMNDGFKGNAPDLGAIELGDEFPHYGPRPEEDAAR